MSDDLNSRNVLGTGLRACCNDPVTGFFRNGYCHTSPDDTGIHTVCIFATKEFLAFSKKVGNDLSTPVPEYEFPGIKPGDRWCLCAGRWVEAYKQGFAPPVILESTHEETLAIVSLDILEEYAYVP